MANTIGEILKTKRENRGLSVQDIAKETHIRVKYLEAFESNRFDLLPSEVQGRGFLRLYAEYLDLDAEPLTRAWGSGIVEDEDEAGAGLSSEDVIYYESENVSDDKPQLQETHVARQERIDRSPSISDSPLEETKSTAIFSTIGATLRSQRESLELTLDDIEQYTHIRQYYLQAIETGQLQKLPSSVQAKGMIQSYAQFLDINSDDLLLEYAEGLQSQREEKLQASTLSQKKPLRQSKPEKRSQLRRFLTPDLLIGSFAILVLVAFAVWSTSRVIARRNETAQAVIPGISDILAATVSQTAASSAEQEEFSETRTPPAMPTQQVAQNSPETPDAGQTEFLVSPTFVMMENAPLQVYIIAHQRAYLEVSIDGDEEYKGRILPGNAYPFSGNEVIEIVSGNAAALQIFFNQVDLGTIGSFGQVVNLIFKEQGIMTPTPQFTRTSTPTQQATITLEPTPTPETPTVTPLIE